MSKVTIASGTVHTIPADIKAMLSANTKARAVWQDITPLARNEWICLVISAQKAETRERRLERARSQLNEGQRRPCCWTGCPHR